MKRTPLPKATLSANAPERIYGWEGSQLSIARHYGGCTFNGHDYLVATKEEGQPLVRADVWKRERRTRITKAYEEAMG